MNDIQEQLNILSITKSDIKDAIQSKGVDIDSTEPFSSYGEKIRSISNGDELMPIGSIIMWGKTIDEIPSGWHICDGTEGTPDLRGRFVLGSSDDHPINEIDGEENVTLNIGQMPSHSHRIKYITASSGTRKIYYTVDATNDQYSNTTDDSDVGLTTTSSGSGAAHNNMPPYYVLYYIMKIN